MNNHVNPLVTIVTASYKKFDRIFETIKSVIEQDYSNIEYIIADDGSPNFPENEIVDYISKNAPSFDFKIYHTEVNRGTVKNLNNAYKNSSGELIFNLSCGDVFFSNDVVSKLVNRFQTTKGKVLVASRILYRNNYEPVGFLPHFSERNIINKINDNIRQYAALVTGVFYDMASGSAMYFTRDICEELGFYDEKYTLWEDGPFLAKFLYNYPLTFAYDIISIWYEYGGVSTKKEVNSIFEKDVALFDKTDRVVHLCDLSIKDRKRLKYLFFHSQCSNTFDKVFLYLCHPFIAFYYKIIAIRRNKRFKEDLRILDKMFVK